MKHGLPLTRARLLRRALAAVALPGVYALLDDVAGPRRAAASPTLTPEQHLVAGLKVLAEDGVDLFVPPSHQAIVTARLELAPKSRVLWAARSELERGLAALESRYAPGAAGLTVTVGWGSSYFSRFVPSLGRLLPIDLQASTKAGKAVPAFFDVRRFPSDSAAVLLERNDICVLLRGDVSASVREASSSVRELLRGIGVPTSVRRGFIGDGLPRRLAVAAGVPGAGSIPERAQLFLGFTSTQSHAHGRERIANFETLPGRTDQWPNGYFRHGTTMHLSHLREDLERWYENIYVSRAWTMHRPDQTPSEGTMTLSAGVRDLSTQEDVAAGADSTSLVGHSASMQPVSRLRHAVVDRYGQRHAAGTAVLQRADANTLDNPFAWTSDPRRDRWSAEPAAGLHFVAFSPTSSFFERVRLAMDCHYAGRRSLGVPPRDERLGINAAIAATHRQSFLVPPRSHRSFPLVELL